MGSAIINGLISSELAVPSQFVVFDPAPLRQEQMRALGIHIASSNIEAAKYADIILFAIKPQMAEKVFSELSEQIPPHALLISILAGTPIQAYQLAFGKQQPIVRVMPNLPAQIGQGASGWTSTLTVTPEQHGQARTILQAMGIEVYFDDEHYIDLVTGVSGSGPGFVFLLIEACIDGAVRAGMPRPLAQKLVIQTFKGAALFAESAKENVVELRHMVTSAGGTTAAGLHELENSAVRAALSNAIMAAYKRSVELGEPSHK